MMLLASACVLATVLVSAPTPQSIVVKGPLLGAQQLVRPGQESAFLFARPGSFDVVPWSRLKSGDSTPDATLDIESMPAAAWCVVAGADGSSSLWTLAAGGAVSTWSGRAGASPQTLFTDADVRLPSGSFSLPFARDLDGDGDIDLVVPHANGLQLWFGEPGVQTTFRSGPLVRQNANVDLDFPNGVDRPSTLSERLTIAGFDIADQNGDGHPDLVFKDGDLVQFFWSDKDGRLPETPSFELDLKQVRESLPKGNDDVLDTSNLLKLLESQVSHVARDFDRDGHADLLLRQGQKVSIYRGSATGIDREKAAQVLKTSGNLIAAFALDDNGDGKDDLCMLRVEDVSLGQLLLWIVAGGSLSFDLFAYWQDEPLRFARKPSSQRTLTIDFPSILSIAKQIEEDRDQIVAGFLRMPVSGDFDGDGIADDVVRLTAERQVEWFLDVGKDTAFDRQFAPWNAVVRRFDKEARGAHQMTIELTRLIDWAPLPGRELAAFIEGKEFARRVELPPPVEPTPTDPKPATKDEESASASESLPVMFVLDVDGDGVDDVVVAESSDDTQLVLTPILSERQSR